jgi:anti-sigma B factor antagonist
MVDCYDSEIELLGDLCMLTVTGETDLFTAPKLRRDLDEAMRVTPGDLVLDLSDLDLIDSTALGIMTAAAGRMMTEQRSLVLVVSGAHVLSAFALAGLLGSFSIAATRAEAVGRLSWTPATRRVA